MRLLHPNIPALRSVVADLIAGVVVAFAGLFVVAFFSPPLPLHSQVCGNGWNDPINLAIAGVLIGGRFGLMRWMVGPKVRKTPAGFPVLPKSDGGPAAA
jgi:hypothetical protein